METLDLSVVDWARAQFAVTAISHWVFVPLTLSLGLIMAIMETLYYKTGEEIWRKMTKFWMKLFGVNFALGVAGGLILEFQFGTNWSNYSLLVGDIFGAPLAIEGIMAFFLESTFFVIMFFGWNKVSKGFHLTATWLTWLGTNISAIWILVANAWMQNPAGTTFNIDTYRSEMTDFGAVISPFALNKFFHTVTSSWIIGAAFVVGISCWYLLKKRNTELAHKSIKIGGIIGLAGIVLAMISGDGSAYQVAQKQPMKLAAMEGLYTGAKGQGLVVAGILNPNKKNYNDSIEPYLFHITAPKILSFLSFRNFDAFVPGIKDLLDNEHYTILNEKGEPVKPVTTAEKLAYGKIAHKALSDYQKAKLAKNDSLAAVNKAVFAATSPYYGYGYVTDKKQLVPNVPLTFYSFHFMVILGGFFLLFFVLVLILRRKIEHMKWFQWLAIVSIPLAYLTSFSGWIVAEVGRQPWAIQDLLPTFAAVSKIPVGSIQTTLLIFSIILGTLTVAMISIIIHLIRKGPEQIN
jgi:cytochrome d ubiquinol oxidase subunit I